MLTKRSYKQVNQTRHGKLISLLLLSFIVMLSIANAAMNGEISVSGDAVFRVETDVRITDLYLSGTSNEGLEEYSSSYSTDTIKTGISLNNLNSTVSYKAVVTNSGNTKVIIEDIQQINYNNNNITYSVLEELPIEIEPQTEKELEITFEYGDTLSEVPEDKMLDSILKLEVTIVESVLALGSGENSTTTFFNNGPITKESVETINFLPTVEVGNDAIGYWDASYNKDNSVIAWYTDLDENELYELNIGGYGKVYAQNGTSLFQNFSKVVTINFGKVFDTSKSTSMYAMFKSCSSLANLDLSSLDTSNVRTMYFMFYGCSSLTELDVSTFNTINVLSFSNMFNGCSSLVELDVSNFDTSNVTNIEAMFSGCNNLSTLILNSFQTGNVTSMAWLFSNCSSLTELDLSTFDTSNTTKMQYMFNGCSSLLALDLSNFNTEKTIETSSMFRGCSSLASIDLSSFDTSNATKMWYMFSGCKQLKSVNLKSFNTSNVTEMSFMFDGCSSLVELDVSNFDTSNVTNMSNIFKGCSSLTSLNVSNFDTSNVTNINSMFYNCTSLISIDFKNADFSNVTNYTNMFYNCKLLEEINLSGITSDKYSNDNFIGIINLIPDDTKVYVLDEECASLGESINVNLTFEVYVEPEESITEEDLIQEELTADNKGSLEINYFFLHIIL